MLKIDSLVVVICFTLSNRNIDAPSKDTDTKVTVYFQTINHIYVAQLKNYVTHVMIKIGD